jgi:uncharacterized protein
MRCVLDDPLRTRPIPAPDPLADFFWSSGADGRLRVLRCTDCGFFVQPPSLPCPRCLGTDVGATAVSGAGTVATYTVNVQLWVPDQPPYVIAIVELAEQPGLRLTSNVVECAPERVYVGQPLQVCFVARNGLYYPVFRPDERAAP